MSKASFFEEFFTNSLHVVFTNFLFWIFIPFAQAQGNCGGAGLFLSHGSVCSASPVPHGTHSPPRACKPSKHVAQATLLLSRPAAPGKAWDSALTIRIMGPVTDLHNIDIDSSYITYDISYAFNIHIYMYHISILHIIYIYIHIRYIMTHTVVIYVIPHNLHKCKGTSHTKK